MKIVILERHSVGEDVDVTCFERLGEVAYYNNTVEDEVAERVKDADIIIANKAPMTEGTLKNAHHLKLICEFATGYDNIDMEYCKKRGIKAANVVDYSTAAVTQHTFALALFLYEKLGFYDSYVKSGSYAAQSRFSNFDRAFGELEGKTWGIVGMGNIGRRVAGIAEAFGCSVIFYSASGQSRCGEYRRVEFDTLLKEADFLSLHCPLTERTRHLIDKTALSKMKKTAILINVARGAVVNNEDLYNALENGVIAGAGLDVLEYEPIRKEDFLGRIQDNTKLIITPHMAWASTEARNRVVQETYENIRAYLNGEERNIIQI